MIARNNICSNLNHRITNAPVRYCPMCGEIVNNNIPTCECPAEDHAKKRRERKSIVLIAASRLFRGFDHFRRTRYAGEHGSWLRGHEVNCSQVQRLVRPS